MSPHNPALFEILKTTSKTNFDPFAVTAKNTEKNSNNLASSWKGNVKTKSDHKKKDFSTAHLKDKNIKVKIICS